MKLFQSLSVILLVLWTGFLEAQNRVDKPLRLEFPSVDESQPYQILPCGNKGVLLYYPVKAAQDKNTATWVFTLLDINLKSLWTREFSIGIEFQHAFTQDIGDTVLLGFHDSGKKGSMKKTAYFLLDLQQGTLRSDEFDLPEKAGLTSGKLLYPLLVFSYKDNDDNLLIMVQDLNSKQLIAINPEPGSRCFLEEIRYSRSLDGFTLVYEKYLSKKNSVFVLATYSAKGEEKEKTTLDLPPEQNILNAIRLHPVDNQSLLVLGVYSNQASKNFKLSETKAEESTGIFSGLLVDQELISKNFYNFLDFKNFFNKLRGNRAIYDNRAIKKDQELSSDYRLILHDILEHEGRYLLVAEAYYPEYHTITNWTYDYYGHMVPNYYTVFDGYRYNNIFVCAFDTSGKLIWDNSMEINNILAQTLKKRAAVFFDGKEIIISYLSEGKIASKVIYQDQTLDGIEYVPIESSNSQDRVINNQEEILVHWYNNNFLAWGYQEIKNTTLAENRRIVFYINKVVFK